MSGFSSNAASTATRMSGEDASRSVIEHGRRCLLPAQGGLSLFWDSAEARGEYGCVPVLKRGWESRLQSTVARQELRFVTPTLMATAWCAEEKDGVPADRLWAEAMAVAGTRFLEFSWAAHDGSGRAVRCPAEVVPISPVTATAIKAEADEPEPEPEPPEPEPGPELEAEPASDAAMETEAGASWV